jgi:tetratricopeptide (TPR) repeat protein
LPKKPSKTNSARDQKPEPAQLKAVERLISARDFTQAIARARALVQRFPDHGGANRLLLEALSRGESRGAATLAAYRWAERRPNSPTAQEAFAQYAMETQYALLAYRAAQRLAALNHSAVPPPLERNSAILEEILRQPDGSQVTLEVMEQFEVGKLHMDAQDFTGALRELEGLAFTPARNNRALSLFHLGRTEEALTAALDAWQQDPGNLFALGLAVQVRLYRGDETGARGLLVPLGQAEARRLEDAQAQLAALLLLREDQAAWDAFERSNQASWVGEATGVLEAIRLLYGGSAASRLGRGDQARALWKQALAQYPGFPAARENLDTLVRDGVPPAYPTLFDLGQILPLGAVNALTQGGPEGLDGRFKRLRISNTYLEAIYLSGDERVRAFAAHLLQWRLDHPDPTETDPNTRRVATILRDLAILPIGTTQERFGFLGALRDHNLLGSDETVKILGDQGPQEVRMISTTILRESVPTDLPPDLQTRLESSVQHSQAGRIEAAEADLDVILARIPDHPIALGNLAALRARQLRGQECRELLRRAIETHPDYLLARVNLAGILIEEGKLDEADALLEGLAQRPELHIQEVFALFGVMAMLNRARGDEEGATNLIATLERLVDDEDDEQMLNLAKVRLERVQTGMLGHLAANLKRLLKVPRGLRRSKR